MTTTSRSDDSQIRKRWLLRIISDDPTTEAEFDLSVALSGEGEG